MPIRGAAEELARIRQGIEDFKTECVEATKNAARVLTQKMMDRTPVWSGKTCGSFVWGFNGSGGGAGFAGLPPAPGQQTNKLGLPDGEANRAPAEEFTLSALEGVLSDVRTLGTLTVTNVSPIWDLVDSGSAPTPETARNPGGVSVIAEQVAKAVLGDTFR